MGEAVRGALSIAVLVQDQPDPASGHLVNLRETPGARVILGAELDAERRVQRWLEIHIQHLNGLEQTPAAYREALTNHLLDQRWSATADALAATVGSSLVRAGWERTHPLPLWVDPARGEPVHPVAIGTTERLEVCTDDELLREVGLPEFSTSLARYLWAPALGLESPFVPATSQTPMTGPAADLEEAAGAMDHLVPVNPAGGLCMALESAPMGYTELIEVFGGSDWQGPTHGRAPIRFRDRTGDISGFRHDRGVFLARQGRQGRLIEALHLKVRAWASAVAQVGEFTRRTRRPLLNLTDESFRVHLPAPGVDLPVCWATRVELVRPGDAAELPIEFTTGQCYIASCPEQSGIYRPEIGTGGAGTGSFRIRQAAEGSGGGVVIEGTFSTDHAITPGSSDLIWLTVTAGDDRVELYTRLEQDSALASGEWRLRSIEHRLSDRAAAALKSSEGIAMPGVPFRVLPVTSSPCDLYALGVLGVRTLLVDSKTTLAKALDETISLAKQLGVVGEPDEPVGQRIATMMADDQRWRESLGPHRLIEDDLDASSAFAAVPREIWFELLATLVRCFPGAGPDAIARDYGDARSAGLGTIYESLEGALDVLLQRTQSLIVVDWSSNREISRLIRRLRSGQTPAPASS